MFQKNQELWHEFVNVEEVENENGRDKVNVVKIRIDSGNDKQN